MIYRLIFKRRCAEKMRNPSGLFWQLIDLWLRAFLDCILYGFAMEGRESLAGMTLRQLVTYVAIGVVSFNTTRTNGTKLANRVHGDKFLFEFLKPYSYRGKVLSEAAADFLTGCMTKLLPTILFLVLIGVFVPPANVRCGLLFAGTLLLGAVLWWNLDFLFHLFGFWYETMYSVVYVVHTVYITFAGVRLPYAFLPDRFAAVLKCTPLYYVFAFPMDIYFGALSGGQIVRGVLLQLVFTVVLVFLGGIIFERGKHKLQMSD